MNRAQPFGRYELIDRISAGGMAEVFRARDAERGGAIVALKKILPHVAEDEEFIEMFTDEARIASSLEHPHIARTLDFGSIGTSYYIAFEYVRGKDLRAVYERAVKNGETIPASFLLYVFARIGEGLSYAHARKDANGNPVSIVHRDVSPQNIVVSYGGDVKLIDFGIAKAAGKLSRTAVGAIKGKFGYMSPEQVRGLEIDQRTDVFSLGITMWEMFTRQRLFQADNELLVLEKIRNFKVIAPSSIDPTLPPALDDIIVKALAKDPQDRYQTAKELYRDLNILAQSTGKVASREDVAAYMQKAFSEGNQDASNVSGGLHEPAPESQSGPRETPSRPAGGGMSYKAENSMAADSPKQAGGNDKRSDLDIFEGLGKKNGPAPRASAPPAPPPSRAPAPPAPPSSMGDIGKKTLMGIAAPAVGGQGGPPIAARSQPVPPMPPPTGRISSLPAVNAPPPKSAPPPAPPPAASTKPAPYGVAPSAPSFSSPQAGAPPQGGMDMDWDDEDEATHIFDKEESQAGPAPSAPRPAAGVMAAPPTAPLPAPGRVSAPPAPPRAPMAQTMAMPGQQMPPPPPGTRSAPPPPPSSVGRGFAARVGWLRRAGPEPAHQPERAQPASDDDAARVDEPDESGGSADDRAAEDAAASAERASSGRWLRDDDAAAAEQPVPLELGRRRRRAASVDAAAAAADDAAAGADDAVVRHPAAAGAAHDGGDGARASAAEVERGHHHRAAHADPRRRRRGRRVVLRHPAHGQHRRERARTRRAAPSARSRSSSTERKSATRLRAASIK